MVLAVEHLSLCLGVVTTAKVVFNALTWDFNNGADYTEEVEQQILDYP